MHDILRERSLVFRDPQQLAGTKKTRLHREQVANLWIVVAIVNQDKIEGRPSIGKQGSKKRGKMILASVNCHEYVY